MNTKRVLQIFLCVATGGSLALLSGCTSSSQMNAMQQQLARQEQQIQQFSAQLSGVQPAQADTWAQVQQLRQEMGAVKGQIDDFNNASASIGGLPGVIARMERQQQALRSLETQFGLDLKLDEPMAPAVPGMTPGAPGAYPAGTTPAGVPQPAPGVNAGGALPGGVTLPPPGSAAGITTQPVQQQTQPQTAQQPASKDTATVLYDSGIANFNGRKYRESLNAFTDFTTTYPKHNLIGNAWFWKGESNYALGNFPAAALDYEKVISGYPSSAKAPSAYLKQGLSFQRTGNKDAARVRLQELIKKFPKSAEATRANQVLKELK